MPAFGLNRFTQVYAVAVSDAGIRIDDKPLSCVDKLVSDLWKWAGYKPVTQVFRFLYPFVGGTAVSNSFNLADPSVGRIEWEGSPIHNASGVTGDGVSAYGKTGVTLAGPAVTDAYVMFGIYSRTASSGNYAEIGNYGFDNKPGLLIYSRMVDGLARWYIGTGQSGAVANSQGLFTGMRRSDGLYGYRNGILIASLATPVNVAVDPPTPLLILARPENNVDNETPPVLFTNRNLAFAFLTNTNVVIPLIFSTAKNLELYNYVQSFQTKLGRQV